jgi:hypothetical protein
LNEEKIITVLNETPFVVGNDGFGLHKSYKRNCDIKKRFEELFLENTEAIECRRI